eukprot:2023299-Pyramimonas_sp.AAC.1
MSGDEGGGGSRGAFRWTEWGRGLSTQRVVDIARRSDFGFSLSQATCARQIGEIEFPAGQRRQPSFPVAPSEKGQLVARCSDGPRWPSG